MVDGQWMLSWLHKGPGASLLSCYLVLQTKPSSQNWLFKKEKSQYCYFMINVFVKFVRLTAFFYLVATMNNISKSGSVQSLSCVWLQPHGLQQARLPCPSPAPRACSNSCPSSQWCHSIISSSVVPFFPLHVLLLSIIIFTSASGSFQMSQFFASGGQSFGVSASASVLPVNIHDWFPLRLTGLISLQSKGLSRVFSNTTVRKYQFFGTQLSLCL